MNRIVLCCALALGCAETYDYDPATAGDQEGSARELRGKTSSQFVRAIYADLLGRTPETYELTVDQGGQGGFKFPIDEERLLVGTLDGLGDSLPVRNLIANGILHGGEATVPDKSAVDAVPFIREQFAKLLGREPNSYELAAFQGAWTRDPAVGPRTVIRAIVGSREYQSQ
jgi:hypothetical protein